MLAGISAAGAEDAQAENPMMLLATPELADPVFGQTVLLTAPLREGARIGVILNRPTDTFCHPSWKPVSPDQIGFGGSVDGLRRAVFRILPVALRGKAGMKLTRLGTL